MGSMGVVYSVVVEAVPRFWLKESRLFIHWSDVAKPGGYLEHYIARGRDPGFPDHLELTVCPYPNEKGDHDLLFTERFRLATPPKPTRENQQRGLFGDGNILADARVRGFAEDFLTSELDGASLK
jgi:hypothetical protein